MNILHILKQNKDRWWALPLILPVVLLPVLSVANTLTQLGDGIVALYYLPLSFLLALMLFFGTEALPGWWYRYFYVITPPLGYLKPWLAFCILSFLWCSAGAVIAYLRPGVI